MSWTLPPIASTSPTKTPGKMSRLAAMQARFQAKQMAEKEEKLINLLETREEETMQRVTYGRTSANSFNSYSSSSNSNNSINGSVGSRPTRQQNPPGRVRQMFEERRAQEAQDDRRDYYRNKPSGWNNRYPIDSIEAINTEVRVPVYKQSVTRVNSNNKYSGNYGPRNGQNGNTRGNCNSLDRRAIRGGSQYSTISNGLPRARSQANITRIASSEESSLSSRPPSGIGYNYQKNSKSTLKQNGNLMVSGNMRYSNYQDSPEDELLSQKSSLKSQNNYYQGGTRDYTRPTPPSYNRRDSTSNNRDIGVGRNQISYHDNSPYSSHSSDQSSDPPGFSVIPRRASVHGSRESLIPSPKKSYSRENSFCRQNSFSRETEEQNNRINNRTFRKQKSPWQKNGRSSSPSPNRSPDHSDETDITNSSDYEMRVATRTGAVEREEERRRLKIEMRKREQELLAKIIQQQKELETVKTQKSKVEKELEMQEKQRQKERQALEEKERQLFEEQERRIQEEQERRIQEEQERRIQEEQERRIKEEQERRIKEEKEKINREKYERRQQEEKLKRTSSIRRRQIPSEARSIHEKEKQLFEEPEIPKPEEKLRRSSSIRRRQPPSDTRNLHEKASSNSHKTPFLNRVERAPSADKIDTEEKVVKPSYITNNTKNQRNIEIKSAERNPPGTPQNVRKNSKNMEATLSMNKHTTNDKPAIRKDTTVVRRSVFAPKEQDGLEQCTNCGRNFATDRISKHTEICIKTSKKKRKTFDMTKARVSGTDAQAFVKNKAQLQRKEAQKAKPKPKSDWRKKREEFINALRIAKETQRHIANGGKASDLPPPPPSDNSDYVQCPYCKRRFNDAAAERHIPKCKDIKSNKKR